ncbi:response regulator [Deinococcus apachensis]|uniref:response regulator n=1 Tax=Deinococcus apachensis TaxID=309886 RepID=UPI00036E49B4|nr:response regulator [Deinococcus apachensis]
MSADVLLIEDSADDVLFIRRAFRAAEADVALRVACDGEQALEALGAERVPDLILLDLKLPRVGGLEVLSWLRAQAHLALVPVVVLTGSHEPQDVRGAYELGANSYLVKPVNAEALRHLVGTLGAYWLRLNTRPPGR